MNMERAMRTGLTLGILAAGAAVVSAAHAETITVTMSKIAYVPASVSARVGDVIEWINKDIVGHTATARDKSWDYNILSNKTATMTLTRAGEFDYICRYHPNMVGHISVKE